MTSMKLFQLNNNTCSPRAGTETPHLHIIASSSDDAREMASVFVKNLKREFPNERYNERPDIWRDESFVKVQELPINTPRILS